MAHQQVSGKGGRTAEKRVAKRARQRAAGYFGIKKADPKMRHHNKGRMDREGITGAVAKLDFH
jgi:hypothetical protein